MSGAEIDVEATATAEAKRQLSSGDPDAGEAADNIARGVVSAAGGAAAAAACSATGVGAAAAALCASAGAWLANELYGPVSDFFSGLFGGGSEYAEWKAKARRTALRTVAERFAVSDLQREAMGVLKGIVRALAAERVALGLEPYRDWNHVLEALGAVGLPVMTRARFRCTSPGTGAWEPQVILADQVDPSIMLGTGTYLSWHLEMTGMGDLDFFDCMAAKKKLDVERMYQGWTADRLRELVVNELNKDFNAYAVAAREELLLWLGQAREAASLVAAANAGESAAMLASRIVRRPPALSPIGAARYTSGLTAEQRKQFDACAAVKVAAGLSQPEAWERCRTLALEGRTGLAMSRLGLSPQARELLPWVAVGAVGSALAWMWLR